MLSLLLSFSLVFSMSGLLSPAVKGAGAVPKLGINTVDEVVSAMTLTEKASVLSGSYKAAYDTPDENGRRTAMPCWTTDVAGTTQGISRYGIPSIVMTDGPAGVHLFNPLNGSYPVAYPNETLLASSWDTGLMQKVGASFGEQAAGYGSDLMLAPGMNIQRDPLGGRNFEYYSEDPVVTGEMAAAYTAGVQSQGVGVTIKHFAANNQETNRGSTDSRVDERTLREIYLRGFELAVKNAQPWALMSSYNLLNGTHTSGIAGLLTNILRGEWGFSGMVMTDWGQEGSFVGAVKAQNDLFMPTGSVDSIVSYYQNGEISMTQIDRSVKNILNFVLKTKTFARYQANGYKPVGLSSIQQPDSAKDLQVSRDAATQGMVLLKNNGGALPLSAGAGKNLALYGLNQNNPLAFGGGSGQVTCSGVVSLAQGFDNASIALEPATRALYSGANSEVAITAQQAQQAASSSATQEAVITIGRSSAEGTDRTPTKGSYYLSDAEQSLIDTVSTAFHAAGKKVVVVLNIAGVIEMKSWQDKADAILDAFLPGQECGNATVDVLTGKVNPSGKLAATIANDYTDYPTASSFPGQNNKAVYSEGLYVGYRYFTSFHKAVDFPFGYGLSYTTFQYSNIRADKSVYDGSITISCDVKNTGSVAGREAVQLYVKSPEVSLEEPALQLKGFAKTRLLAPGETQTVSVTVDNELLKAYNEKTAQWVVEQGAYQAMVGASCLDIKGTVGFTVASPVTVQQVENEVQPQGHIDTLSRHDEVTALARVDADGQKVVGVAVKYPADIDPSSVNASALTVSEKLTDTQTVTRAVTKAYANTSPAFAGTGTAGQYLVLELDPADAGAAAFSVQNGQAAQVDLRFDVSGTGTVSPVAGGTFEAIETLQKKPQVKTQTADNFAQSVFNDYNGVKLQTRLYTPAMTSQLTDKYPLVVALHDDSARGSDNSLQLMTSNMAVSFAENAASGANRNAYVLAPQLPAGESWTSAAVRRSLYDLIRQTLVKNPNIDPYRVYIAGVGTGAGGALSLAEFYPGLFAAALLSGPSLSQSVFDGLQTINSLPIAIYEKQGTTGALSGKAAADALTALGDTDVSYTAYSGTTPAFAPAGTAWLYGFALGGLPVNDENTNLIYAKDTTALSGVYFQQPTDDCGYSIGWINYGDTMDYRVNVEKTDTYRFDFGVASPSGAAGAVKLLVDGVQKGTADAPATGDWQMWGRASIEGVSLTKGVHTIRVLAGADNWNFERMILTGSQAVADNEVRPGSRVILSVLNADAYSGMLYENAGLSQGYNFAWVDPGDFSQFTVNVKDAGSYNIALGVSSGAADAIKVTVDGTDAGVLTAPSTGSWQIYENTVPLKVSLAAGKHSVRITALKSGWNLTNVTISDSSLALQTLLSADALLAGTKASTGSWGVRDVDPSSAIYQQGGGRQLSSADGSLTLQFKAGFTGFSAAVTCVGTDQSGTKATPAASSVYSFAWSADGVTFTPLACDPSLYLHRDFSGYYSGVLPFQNIPQQARYLKIAAPSQTDAAPAITSLRVAAMPEDPAASAAEDLITALPGTVGLADADAVAAAKAAYDKLTDAQKALVGDAAAEKLQSAVLRISALADQAAADAVASAINKLPGTVTLADSDSVAAARAAYDKLTDAQKALVADATLQQLANAEKTLAALAISSAPSTSTPSSSSAPQQNNSGSQPQNGSQPGPGQAGDSSSVNPHTGDIWMDKAAVLAAAGLLLAMMFRRRGRQKQA